MAMHLKLQLRTNNLHLILDVSRAQQGLEKSLASTYVYISNTLHLEMTCENPQRKSHHHWALVYP